jgi:hypothetical protein
MIKIFSSVTIRQQHQQRRWRLRQEEEKKQQHTHSKKELVFVDFEILIKSQNFGII